MKVLEEKAAPTFFSFPYVPVLESYEEYILMSLRTRTTISPELQHKCLGKAVVYVKFPFLTFSSFSLPQILVGLYIYVRFSF